MARHNKTGQPGLYKIGGRYFIDLKWSDGKTGNFTRHQHKLVKGTSSAAAREHAKSDNDKATAGGWDGRHETPIEHTLGEALDKYAVWSETNQRRSLRSRRSLITVIKGHLGESVPLDQVDNWHFDKLKRERQAAKAAPATVNRSLALLKHLLYVAAYEWGWITRARAVEIREGVELLEEPEGRVRELSPKEEAALFGALVDVNFKSGKVDPRRGTLRDMIACVLLTALREGEVCKLEQGWVNLEQREIIIPTGVRKNRKELRVPIAAALVPILERHLAVKEEDRAGAFVFTSARKKPYTTDGFRACFTRAVKRAKLRDLHFHDCRHTAACRMRSAGIGLDVIQAVLGHSDIRVTQRYARVDKGLKAAAVATLPDPLGVSCPFPVGSKGREDKAS